MNDQDDLEMLKLLDDAENENATLTNQQPTADTKIDNQLIDSNSDLLSSFDFKTAATSLDAASDEQNNNEKLDSSVALYGTIINMKTSITAAPSNTSNSVTNNSTSNKGSQSAVNPNEQFYPTPITIGNLTWWTKDTDIEAAIRELGVNDMVRINFRENKLNGSSVGIADIKVVTEESYNILLKRLGDVEIYNHRLRVLSTSQTVVISKNKKSISPPGKQSRSNSKHSKRDRGSRNHRRRSSSNENRNRNTYRADRSSSNDNRKRSGNSLNRSSSNDNRKRSGNSAEMTSSSSTRNGPKKYSQKSYEDESSKYKNRHHKKHHQQNYNRS